MSNRAKLSYNVFIIGDRVFSLSCSRGFNENGDTGASLLSAPATEPRSGGLGHSRSRLSRQILTVLSQPVEAISLPSGLKIASLITEV